VTDAQLIQVLADALENTPPPMQSVQVSSPVMGLNLPATHPSHTPFTGDQPALHKQSWIVPPVMAENEFDGHRWHSASSSVLYKPSPHSVHAADPGFGLNLPAKQPTQSSAVPDHPGLHKHELMLSSPSDDSEFGRHLHASDPELSLYLPVTQTVHLSTVPVNPALHKHAVMLSLMTGENEFCGHVRHAVLFSFEYEPATQSIHVLLVEFTCVNIEPAVQERHVSVDAFTRKVNFPAPQDVQAIDPGLRLYLPATHPIQLSCIPDHPALHEQLVMLSLPTEE